MDQLDHNFLLGEIYSIPRPDGTLIYAPLTRSFLLSEEKPDELSLPDGWLEDATSPNNVPPFVIDSLLNKTDNTIRLRFNVTNGCNLHCEYCSVGANQTQITNMSPEMAQRIVLFFLEECVF